MATDNLSALQLVIVVLFALLVIRWYRPRTATPNVSNPVQRYAAQVDTILSMFPQYTRREILWDLQSNRGNVNVTTERILAGRGLGVPPPSFQPQFPDTDPVAPPSNPQPKPEFPDLITRYKLEQKILQESQPSNTPGSTDPVSVSATGNGWSQSKQERHAALQRRREEMILAARRKMQERDLKDA